jgi:hypothetical protein
MGNLKPGASYSYEHKDGVTYASEAGDSNKQVHGWMYDNDHPEFDPRTGDGRPLREHIMDAKMWGEIRRAARTNPTLQEALERVKILYHLSKDNAK